VTLDDAALDRLVEQAKSGDADAFGRIFDHFHEPLYAIAASSARQTRRT
jgi:hypothetical protein